MNKKSILIVALLMVCTIILCGCSGNLINPPKPEITSKSTRTGFEGLDYVVYVDTVIYNRGGSGEVTVWAKVTQGGNGWSKKQDIHMNEEEMRSLTFTFREFSFWDLSTGSYSIWTET